MGLAGDEGAEVLVGRHRALEAGEEGKGRRVALAGPGRTLHQEHRGAAMAADELALARLEPMQRARRMERIETGHEPRLTLRPRLGPERQRPFLAGQHGVERVLATGDQSLGNLRGPRSVDVIRIRVEGVGLPGSRGCSLMVPKVNPLVRSRLATHHHDLGPGLDRSVTVAPTVIRSSSARMP